MKKLLFLLILTAFVRYDTATANAPSPFSPFSPFSPHDLGEVQISMTWWGTDARTAAVNAALDLFEERFPNVTVDRLWGPFAGYLEDFTLWAAAGQPPDLFQFHYPWLAEWDGFFLDLQNVAHVLDLTEISDGPVDMLPLVTNALGEVAAFPTGVNGRVIVYNRDILGQNGLASLPQTLHELTANFGEHSDFFQTANPHDTFLAFSEPHMDDIILTWLYNETGRPLVTDGEISYTVEEVAAAFAAFAQLLESRTLEWSELVFGNGLRWNADLERFRLERLLESDEEVNRAGAVSLNVGNIFSIVSNNDGVLGFMGEPPFDNMGIALFPPLSDGGRQTILHQPTNLFAIPSHTAQPELAAFLLNWLHTDEDAHRLLHGEFGLLTTRTAFQLAFRENRISEPLVELMELFGASTGTPITAMPPIAQNSYMVIGRTGVISRFFGDFYEEWGLDGTPQFLRNPTQAARDWIDNQNGVLLEYRDIWGNPLELLTPPQIGVYLVHADFGEMDFLPSAVFLNLANGGIEPFIPVSGLNDLGGGYMDSQSIFVFRHDFDFVFEPSRETFSVNGVEMPLDVPVMPVPGVGQPPWIPLRPIFETMGFSVELDAATNTIYLDNIRIIDGFGQSVFGIILPTFLLDDRVFINAAEFRFFAIDSGFEGYDGEYFNLVLEHAVTGENIEFDFTLGSYSFTVNGVELPLDAPARRIYNLFFVPIRPIYENLGVSVAWNSETGNVVLTFPGELQTGNVIMTVPSDLSEIENRLQNIEIMRENVLLFRDLIFRQFAFLRTFEELGRERLVTTFDILVETSQELGLFFEEWLWVYGEIANIAYEISRLVEDFSDFHWAMSLAGERFESIDRSVADLLEFLENIEEELRRIEQNLQSAADSEYHDIAELSQETQILTIYLFLRDVEGFVWQAEQVNRAFVANVEEISENLDVAHSYMNELLEHSDAALFLTNDFIRNLIRFLEFQSVEDEIVLLRAVDDLTDLLLWYFGDIMRNMGELLGFERDFPEPSESLLWTVPAAIADLSEIFLLKAPQLADSEFFALFRQLRDVEMLLYELHITWPLSTIEIIYQTFAIYQEFDEVEFIEENIRVFETDINEILNHWHGELSPDGLLMLEDVQAGIAEYFTVVADIISNVVAGSAAENLQAERVRILYDEIIPVLHELQNAVYWEIVFEFDGVSITLESPQTEIGFSEIMGILWIMQEELGQVGLAISDFARGENLIDAAHILYALPLEIIQENWIIENFRLLHDFAQNNAHMSDSQRAELRGFLIDLESGYSELLLILVDIQELIRNATNENFSETLDIVGRLLAYLEELLPSMSNRIEQISEFLVEVI